MSLFAAALPLLPVFLSAWLTSWLAACSAFTVVSHLPGFDGPLPFYLETGYVQVDELKDAHLFYYFVKSERWPKEDPLLFWLTGGPFCSGFSALAYEIGPLLFDVAGYTDGLPNLFYNPYTWTKVSNIIFVDSPVGTGFSYPSQSEYYEAKDTQSTKDVYTFIRKWFIDHQEFLANPLYIAGDSYGGKLVPIVAQKIADGNQDGVLFNLKGYLVGNPVTDNQFDDASVVPYAHGMGLISDELYKSAKESCGEKYAGPKTAKCANSLQLIDECLDGLYVNYILEPKCPFAAPKPHKVVTGRRQVLEQVSLELLSEGNLPLECRSAGYRLSYIWANNDTVREALHIYKDIIDIWKRCDLDLPYEHDITSAVKFHQNLTSRGFRALVYSGDHDLYVPHVGTQAWIRSLNSSISDDWRPWWVKGQIAGYTRSYSNNLTFATVKGGGHTAPEYKPKECQAMLERWLSQCSL